MSDTQRSRAETASEQSSWAGESGATATEYGMLVGFVALALAISVGIFGTSVSEFYEGFVPQIEALFGTIE